MLRAVRAVLFDFDHTLGVDHKLEERVLRALAAEECGLHPSNADLSAILRRFRSGIAPLGAALVDGVRSLGCTLADPDAFVSRYKAQALRLAPESVTPMPGARETLRALADLRMPTGILSNGWTELQHRKADLIGFEGPTIASEEIGAWKPDPAAFLTAARRMGLSHQATLYVGDDPAIDIAGAKSAGMLAAWVDSGPAPYPSGIASPDVALTSLAELPGLLEAQGAAPA